MTATVLLVALASPASASNEMTDDPGGRCGGVVDYDCTTSNVIGNDSYCIIYLRPLGYPTYAHGCW
ncbi:MAG: hypothetical protein WC876_08660 [Candidatus Thermoplasmatota archaeon]